MKNIVTIALFVVSLFATANTFAIDIPLPTCGTQENPCEGDGPTPFYPPVPACALIPPYCTMP